MGAATPVAIGTRGTVGSLVRREIEYFNKIDMNKCGSSSNKPQVKILNGSSRPSSFWSLKISWKKKKTRGTSTNGFIIPGICDTVEVADSKRFHGNIPGFRYRILKDDLV